MRYWPHTPEDVAAMLEVIGAKSVADLFASIPADCRRQGELNLPEPLTEWDLTAHLQDLADNMGQGWQVFFGAGSNEHHIPESIRYLLGRSEFSTAYTPYQPEMSQGTLQAIFEYQSLVCRLLGLEVANASLYDGAMALAEALLMAVRITRRSTVAVSRLIHPAYRQVVQTYFRPTNFNVVELPYLESGRTDLTSLGGRDDLAAVALQSPNFLGCVEDLAAAGQTIHDLGSLFVVSFTEPLAYGLLKTPGTQGADIACGEGQSFGISRSFGGPGLGMLATRMQYVRNIPGRLVGQTTDLDGRRGFVLTLSTREQHIRREKAVSNICTNNSLCALNAAMYLASLGGTGLRELARMNHSHAQYLKNGLLSAGLSSRFTAPTFSEFALAAPASFAATRQRLMEKKILAGLPLGRYYPELDGQYLFGATEVRTRAQMDALIKEI